MGESIVRTVTLDTDTDFTCIFHILIMPIFNVNLHVHGEIHILSVVSY